MQLHRSRSDCCRNSVIKQTAANTPGFPSFPVSRPSREERRVPFSLIASAAKDVGEGSRRRSRGGTDNNACGSSPDFFRAAFTGQGLFSPLHTARGDGGGASASARRRRRTARDGVSLKNRVAIPVSTWRKMKRAFHAPTLLSRVSP